MTLGGSGLISGHTWLFFSRLQGSVSPQSGLLTTTVGFRALYCLSQDL